MARQRPLAGRVRNTPQLFISHLHRVEDVGGGLNDNDLFTRREKLVQTVPGIGNDGRAACRGFEHAP